MHRWAVAVYRWQPTHKQRLVGFVLVVALGAWGLWRVESAADDAHDAAELSGAATAALADFIDDSRTTACANAVDNDLRDQQLLVRIARDAGADQELIDIIERSYADRPEPSACTPPSSVP